MSAFDQAQAGPERRRYVRYELDARVELQAGGRRTTYQTEDLGAGGCRITVAQPLEKGAEVAIRLSAPASPVVVTGTATVAWASRTEPFRVGLQFSDEVAEQAIGFIHSVLGSVDIHA